MMMAAERVFEKYPFDNSDTVIAYVPLYRKKCIVPRKIFEGSRTGMFNNFAFPIPYESENLLTALYGDYLTLPPEEKKSCFSL